MDKTVKTRWIKALRSGRYKQGQGYLARNGKYCCLGVLAKITRRRIGPDDIYIGGEVADPDVCGLTPAQQRDLSRRNDGLSEFRHDQHTFTQIADYIESNL